MNSRRLILCLLSALFLLPSKVSATENSPCMEAGIGRTEDRPQWQDLGMCDVLAITNVSIVAPPSTVRVVHDSPTGTVTMAQAVQTRYYSTKKISAYSRYRSIHGYIYLIRCLRL